MLLRPFYLILGILALILGVIGIVLPILPTFPFIMLATYCFFKGSKRLHAWLTHTTLYQRYVKDFNPKKGMTLTAKLIILIPVIIVMIILFIAYDILAMRIAIVAAVIIKTIVFIRIKTLR